MPDSVQEGAVIYLLLRKSLALLEEEVKVVTFYVLQDSTEP